MYHPNQIKEETRVIFQDRAIDFRILDKDLTDHQDLYNQIKHTGGLLNLKPGKKLHIRLYTSTAGIKIDGYDLDVVNQYFLSGETPFVILENSGKFAPGNVNYLTFECIQITTQMGNASIEIKVTINVLQEKALGHTSGMADWAPNTYYDVNDDIIGPDKRLYNCTEAHTSTVSFDVDKWERQGSLDQTDLDDFEEGLQGFIDELT
tara:strand:+ start:3786 stop:4403 length:618 start_codon:yes stop_codon:yes gene_type:complete